ncbi:hypothetical protein [Nonomuraea sp. LPB2021202275-12-8]|uniref:hypothetical protein n=1 Tax=Nonomuraea sp. LPB2021202275-12-8 TaxID=3120159 RepID=UPI00300C0A63
MSADVLGTAWPASWRGEIDRALKPLMTGFENTYGHPPGDNLIIEAGEGSPPRQSLPRALTVFYRVIHEVSLPDIGNGYFIHAADHVHDELEQLGPVRLNRTDQGLVFASEPWRSRFSSTTYAF